jgi:hypothetical protein
LLLLLLLLLIFQKKGEDKATNTQHTIQNNNAPYTYINKVKMKKKVNRESGCSRSVPGCPRRGRRGRGQRLQEELVAAVGRAHNSKE